MATPAGMIPGAPGTGGGLNWPLIGGIIAGVILIGLLSFLAFSGNSKSTAPPVVTIDPAIVLDQEVKQVEMVRDRVIDPIAREIEASASERTARALEAGHYFQLVQKGAELNPAPRGKK